MPFSVRPSTSLVISGQSITRDDFLKVILEDGEVLYVRSARDSEDGAFVGYTFDQEFLPEILTKGLKDVVDEWYKFYYKGYARAQIREEQRDLFAKKGGLRGQLQARLASTLYVSNGGETRYEYGIDVGLKVFVTAHCIANDGRVFDASYPSSDPYRNTCWTFSAPIAAILPTTRAAIRKEFATS